MTDNEIIKALEICSHRNGDLPCKGCPAYSIAQMCMEDLMSDALDLIKRQKAEIERLQSMNQAKLDTIHDLRADIREMESAMDGFRGYDEEIKSEAVREFAERLKKKYRSWEDNHGNWIQYIELDYIDNLVKEMTEVRK